MSRRFSAGAKGSDSAPSRWRNAVLALVEIDDRRSAAGLLGWSNLDITADCAPDRPSCAGDVQGEPHEIAQKSGRQDEKGRNRQERVLGDRPSRRPARRHVGPHPREHRQAMVTQQYAAHDHSQEHKAQCGDDADRLADENEAGDLRQDERHKDQGDRNMHGAPLSFPYGKAVAECKGSPHASLDLAGKVLTLRLKPRGAWRGVVSQRPG